jgi:chemotaxis protein histidine kinase CheA
LAPAESSDSDAEFQDDLRRSFIEGLPAILATLRTLLKGLIKAENDTTRLKQLNDLYRRIHALTGNAGIAGMLQVARMADALEALLKELYEKPKNINASRCARWLQPLISSSSSKGHCTGKASALLLLS